MIRNPGSETRGRFRLFQEQHEKRDVSQKMWVETVTENVYFTF